MLLQSPYATQPTLLRAEYSERRFRPADRSLGLFRFAQWLPIRRTLSGSSAPITYHSQGLGSVLGLKRLYITFSGYWPERNVYMLSGTFKECEAYAVCARACADGRRMVVASAGNTARAFIRVCSQQAIPLLIVVPQRNLASLWTTGEVADCVQVVVLTDGADYSDAIALAKEIAELEGFFAEGGALNVARRAGMGCTLLSAAEEIGETPDWYVQAVGSGTGAIAAWEAWLQLQRSGLGVGRRMRIMAIQNAPFQPMYDAWRARSRRLAPCDPEQAKRQIASLYATVLSNRTPPYSIIGGLYDALADTDGEMAVVDNRAAMAAQALFQQEEGIDIDPAAATATAALIQQVESGRIGRAACIMLNITGGGMERLAQTQSIYAIEPDLLLPRSHWKPAALARLLSSPVDA